MPLRSQSVLRLVLAVALFVAGTSVLAQPWQGQGRVSGTVRDSDGEPLRGASVRLGWDEAPGQGPQPVLTDVRGRWTIHDVAPGRWRIVVEADEHIAANGVVLVPASGRARPVEIQLRSLDEVTPSFAENEQAVVVWLEKGDSLFKQGRNAAARAEYEKAVGQLPPGQRPQVLQAIAHAHFLEGHPNQAAETLQEALRYGPDNAELRALLVEVGAQTGTDVEVAGFLERLDAGEELPAPEPGAEDPAGPAPPVRPLLPAEPGRLGQFRTTFEERGPLSGLEEFMRRYGATREEIEANDAEPEEIRLSAESFEVYVPDGYDDDTPHGLFVWISPGTFGGTERDDVQAVFDRLRVISIGANNSGNQRPRWDRFALALEAAHHMQRLYNIDPARVWVAGYSGGGRMSTSLALLYPEVFQGAFAFYGCDFYQRIAVPDRPGAVWPAAFRQPSKDALKLLKRDHRFVLLTGERDFNRQQTRRTYETMKQEGFRHVTFLEIPGADHYHAVDADYLLQGLEYLGTRK